MILGILKEESGERRVTMLPEHLKKLEKVGFTEFWVESGAGEGARQNDDTYTTAGAIIKSKPTSFLVQMFSCESHRQTPKN